MSRKLISAVIFDIDGTLLDDTEQKKLMPKDKKDREGWNEYLKFYDLCVPNKPCVELVKKFSNTHKIIFITAREDRFNSRKDTEIELIKAIGDIDFMLLMRKDDDFRESSKVKKELYKEHVKNKYNVLFVADDDKKNIKMFKKQGITGLRYYEVKK